MSDADVLDQRVLVLARSAGDRQAIERLLEADGRSAHGVPSVQALVDEIALGAGVAVVTEEALRPEDQKRLIDTLATQPDWSYLPLILLTLRHQEPSRLVDRLRREARGAVTILERPIRTNTLLAAVQASLRARGQQLAMRDELARRQRAERALFESEERFRIMADELPHMIWVHDSEGRQQYVNRTFCRYFDVSPEQARGDWWQSRLHPEDSAYGDAFQAAVAERRSFHGEVRVRHVDGSWRWLESWGEPRFGPSGRYLGHIGTSADVSDRKWAEQALHEKTQALEEADHRKDQFLATLGHELRNPLAALDLALHLLDEGGGDAERLRRGMKAQVEQLTHLVNQLLEVARITRGKVALRKSGVDLVALVRTVAETVESQIRERQQSLRLVLPERLTVEADLMRLEQIVVNLLSNASEYTPLHGRVEVRVSREGERARLVVRDTGQGLRSDQLESIFEPFVQADPLGGGLGIGLSVVKGLVELHGGSVRAESEGPGRGAVFTIDLPVGESLPAAEPGRGYGRRLARPLRVLVIDDNRDFADSLALLLERMGAEARCAYTGGEGLSLAREWRPAAALVDIALPDMDGYSVARRLRGLEGEGAAMLLLAVTGFGHQESAERARLSGFDARLLKPLDPERLYWLLEERARGVEHGASETKDHPAGPSPSPSMGHS